MVQRVVLSAAAVLWRTDGFARGAARAGLRKGGAGARRRLNRPRSGSMVPPARQAERWWP